MKKTIFFTLVLFLAATWAWADTVVLNTGQKIEGKIIERNGEMVKIDFEGVELSYMLSEVDSINAEKVSAAVSAEAAEGLAQPAVSVIAPSAAASSSAGFPALPQDVKLLPGIIVGVALAAISLVLLFYVFYSLCLQLVAKKTQASPEWLAWVPVANLFLICKMAGLRYWWLLLMAAAFIPYLGILSATWFTGLAWYKIALARGKPGWVGILCVIPLVNLATMGYLAFSK